MKLIRSDSPEVATIVASAGARASRRFSAFVYGCFLNVLILLIAIAVSLIVSARAAAWFGASTFLAWNVYVLWLLKFSSRTWVIAAYADRVCIRPGVNNPNVIMLEVSEIASMSIRTVEVFLYGPKAKFVDWLVIETVQAQLEDVTDHIASFLRDIPSFDPSNPVNVVNEGRRLIIGWKWCQPALRIFLQKLVRECPSVLIAPEEHSELDLNGIWNRVVSSPDAKERRMLVEAKRLGFGSECVGLLIRHQYILHPKAAEYLAEIEREEAGSPTHDPPQK